MMAASETVRRAICTTGMYYREKKVNDICKITITSVIVSSVYTKWINAHLEFKRFLLPYCDSDCILVQLIISAENSFTLNGSEGIKFNAWCSRASFSSCGVTLTAIATLHLLLATPLKLKD